MSKIFRALLISAVAGGAFAVAYSLVTSSAGRPARDAAPGEEAPASPHVDADAMPKAQRDALLDELAAQL